jgi:hypothetical protein
MQPTAKPGWPRAVFFDHADRDLFIMINRMIPMLGTINSGVNKAKFLRRGEPGFS